LDPAALGGSDIRAAALVSDELRLDAVRIEDAADVRRLTFPRRVDRWGTGTPAELPTGGFTLQLTLADGTTLSGEPGRGLITDLPTVRADERLRLNLRMRRKGV